MARGIITPSEQEQNDEKKDEKSSQFQVITFETYIASQLEEIYKNLDKVLKILDEAKQA